MNAGEVPPSRRHQHLTEATLDYVLRHGLLGLSLRPLAASLGTSDRMLIYHFGSKAGLITEVLELANSRLAGTINATADNIPASRTPRQVVEQAWQLMTSAESD